jgi:hypothetical protein
LACIRENRNINYHVLQQNTKWHSVIKKLTLILASRRMNMGTFFSA